MSLRNFTIIDTSQYGHVALLEETLSDGSKAYSVRLADNGDPSRCDENVIIIDATSEQNAQSLFEKLSSSAYDIQ